MVISLILGFIPNEVKFVGKLKLIIYNWAAKTCFRILSRSCSALIRFRNQEFRPKSDGICVANHTSPVDAMILSCDNTYALVNIWVIKYGINVLSNFAKKSRATNNVIFRYICFVILHATKIGIKQTIA